MRPAKHQRKRRQQLQRDSQRSLADASYCEICCKYGYPNEQAAIASSLSGQSGVRAYLNQACGMWHLTNRRKPPPTPKPMQVPQSVGQLTDDEHALVLAVRQLRWMRENGAPGQQQHDQNTAAQGALRKAAKPIVRRSS